MCWNIGDIRILISLANLERDLARDGDTGRLARFVDTVLESASVTPAEELSAEGICRDLEPDDYEEPADAQAINEVIDAYGTREAGINRHVPEAVPVLLYCTFLIVGRRRRFMFRASSVSLTVIPRRHEREPPRCDGALGSPPGSKQSTRRNSQWLQPSSRTHLGGRPSCLP